MADPREQKPEEEFSVANLLRAQKELLTGADAGAPVPGRAHAPAGYGPPPSPYGGATAAAAGEESSLNLMQYFWMIVARKWTVLLVTALVTGAALAFAYLRQQTYVARTKITIPSDASTLDVYSRRVRRVVTSASLLRLKDERDTREIASQLLKAWATHALALKSGTPEEISPASDVPAAEISEGPPSEVAEDPALERPDPNKKKVKSVIKALTRDFPKLGKVPEKQKNEIARWSWTILELLRNDAFSGRELKELADGKPKVPFDADRIGEYMVSVHAQQDGRKGTDRGPKFRARLYSAIGAQALVVTYILNQDPSEEITQVQEAYEKNEQGLRDKELKIHRQRQRMETATLPGSLIEKADLLEKKKERRDQIEHREMKHIKDKLAVIREGLKPAGAGSPLPHDLKEEIQGLKRKLREMSQRLTSEHPKRKALEREIHRLTHLSEEEIRELYGIPATFVGAGMISLELQRIGLESQRDGLRDELNELKSEIAKLIEQIANFEEKSADPDVRKMKEMILDQMALEEKGREIRQRLSALRRVEAEFLSSPASFDLSSPGAAMRQGPGPVHVAIFGLFIGLFAGALLVLLREHVDTTVRSPMDVRRIAALPTLAVLPRFRAERGPIFCAPDDPRSGVSEAFSVFRNHIRYSARNTPEQRLLVTSAREGEGKSYLATNLALSFAMEGNHVVLVDADLRRSQTHQRLDVLRPQGPADAGLCQYLEGSVEYDQARIPTEHENLSAVLSGGRANNPPKLLRSERMKSLLLRLEDEFDIVIVDGPPVLPVVDPAVIANFVRGVLMVVRHGHTQDRDLAECANRLRHVNAPLIGVVLNEQHRASPGYYYSGYYHRYYRYGYGYGYGHGSGYGYGYGHGRDKDQE